MINIQKKSLSFVSKTLGAYSTYKGYDTMITALSKIEGLTEPQKKQILSYFQDRQKPSSDTIREAKEWVDSILADLP